MQATPVIFPQPMRFRDTIGPRHLQSRTFPGAAFGARSSGRSGKEAAMPLKPHVASGTAAGSACAAGTATILVVDDDRLTAMVLGNLLRRSGYRVVLAHDGVAAWKVLHHDHIDAIISDFEMPRLDGVALLERVRASTLKMPFFLVSGASAAEIHQRVSRIRHGNLSVFPKPIDERRILAVLAAKLRHITPR